MKKFTVILILALLLTVALTLTACDELCNHDIVIDEAVPATCTEGGFTEGKHCSRCFKGFVAQEKIPALGHTEVIDQAVPSTCTTTGLTEGKHCATCGEVLVEQQVIEMCAHTEEIIPAVPSTCTTTGLTEGKRCTVCGKTTVEQQVVGMHNIVAGQARPATCTTTGLTAGRYCNICGETIEVQQVIDALGHTEEILPAVPATCTTSGLTEGKHCTTCGKDTVEQKVVDALEHTEEILSAVAPTCTTTGLTEGKRCSTCDKVLVAQEVVDALGHTEGAVVVENNVAPTCTTDGSYDNVVRCTVCEVELSRETVVVDDALGHVNNENGACVRCDYSYFTYQFGSNELGEYYDIIKADKSISGDIVIPSTYNGKPIREISAFTFQYCHNLTGVTVPDTVNFIGQSAFGSCDNLQKAVLNNAGLIFNDAFAGCTNLTDVTITNAYYIKDGAFDGCGFASITIPASVRQVTDNAFVNCNNLAEIKVDANSQYLKAVDDVLYSIDGTSLILYAPASNGEAFVIPAEVTIIGSEAFSGCQNLKTIIIPNTVTKLGTHYNFNGCTSLTSVVIPDSVTTIGNHAFSQCDNLTSVTIPDSVTILEESAFSLCDNLTTVNISSNSKLVTIGRFVFEGYNKLTSITIPNTVTTIGERAFYNCRELTDIYFTGTEAEWNAIVIAEGNDALANATIHFIEIRDAVAPTCTETGLTEGKYCATCDKVLVAQEVVDTLEHNIVNHKAKAPTCTQIGWDAYEACSRCDYSTYNEIPATGHDIDENDVCIHGDYAVGVTYIPVKNGMEYELVEVNKNVRGDFVVPSKFNGKPVTAIANNAFSGCVNLTSIKIEEGYYNLTIGSSAFAKCARLKTIEIPSNVTKIEDDAFHDCLSLTDIYYYGSEDRWDDVYDVIYLPSAGIGTDLENVKIHFIITLDAVEPTCTKTGLTEGKYCETCKKTVVAQESIDALGHDYDSNGNCWVCEDPESRYTLTEDGTGYILERIANKNLAGTYVMENMYNNKPITVIGKFAFDMCAQLESVVISDSVTTIEEMAFTGCTSLTSVVIPKSVTIIGMGAFSLCDNLTDIYFTGTEAEWNALTKNSLALAGTSNVTIHFNYVPEQN